MDYIPQLTFNGTTQMLYKNIDYTLNATVTDLDGVTDINQNSVYVTYYETNPLINKTLKLTYATNLSSTIDLFSTIIPASDFSNYNGTITALLSGTDMEGSQASSSPIYLQIDTAGPIISSITFNGGVPVSNWVTSAGYTPSIVVQFTDGNGIQDATVNYGINGSNSFMPISMTNQTLKSSTMTLTTFNATLPAYSSTETIAFYFISHDYLSNVNTTANYYYIVDNTAPVLLNYQLNPNVEYISNSTTVSILYNVTEVSAVKSIIMFYSYNNGSTWSNNTASQINYNAYKVTSTSTYPTLPYNIPSGTSNLQLQVDQPRVDTATLKLGLTFDEGSYLRIYLIGNNKSVILFDRVQGTYSNKLFAFDLFSLGFTKEDLQANDFYLSIVDYSNNYFGQITQFQFTFAYYTIPYGYQWMNTVPMSINDTIVKYYFNATDFVNNTAFTNVYSYFADGDAPTMDVLTNTTNQIQLNSARTIEVSTLVQDQGGIFDVELYYRFDNTNSFQIVLMQYDNVSKIYSYSVTVPVSDVNGTFYYYIKSYDNVGFTSISPEFNMTYITPLVQGSTTESISTQSVSLTSNNSSSGDILGIIGEILVGLVIIGIIGAAGAFTYFKVKEKKTKPKT